MSLPDHVELRRIAVAKLEKAEAIVEAAENENRGLTEDEDQEFDALMKEHNELLARADRIKTLRTITTTHDESRSTAPKVVPASSSAEVVLDEADRPFRSLGEQLQSIYRAAVHRQIDPRLMKLESRASGLSELTGPDGGFLVQQDFRQEIVRQMWTTGQVLSRTDRITLTSAANGIRIPAIDETSRATGSRWGGVQGYWVQEGAAATASKPKLRIVDLRLRKLAALGYATDELLADAGALGTIMQQAFVDELTFLAEDAIINGTGVGEPLGLLNAGAKIAVAKESGQAAATVVYQNIVNAWSRMPARHRANAVWLISQDVEPQLYQMSLAVGTGGSAVYLPPGGLSASPFSTLLGRPVIPVEYCATLGTEGDVIFVDLSQVALIDKGGIQAASSIHVKFVEHEQAFRVTYRVDAAPKWSSAVTPKNGGPTVSPYITLATRA